MGPGKASESMTGVTRSWIGWSAPSPLSLQGRTERGVENPTTQHPTSYTLHPKTWWGGGRDSVTGVTRSWIEWAALQPKPFTGRGTNEQRAALCPSPSPLGPRPAALSPFPERDVCRCHHVRHGCTPTASVGRENNQTMHTLIV